MGNAERNDETDPLAFHTGDRLRKAREMRGMDRTQLANELGTTRKWNGAQWMVWDGAQWLPERQPYQPAKPISDKTRVLAAVIAIAFFVGVMVVGTFVAADLMK